MLKRNFATLMKYAEPALAVVSFGGSSVYWLALAFAMSPAAYGKMMTLQAAVLIVTTLFTFRTHDLLFNLLTYHGHSIDNAFRKGIKSEIIAVAAGTLVCSVGAFIVYPSEDARMLPFGIAALAFLVSIGANQGSSIAKLRYFSGGHVVAATDLLCALTWAVACISILLVKDHIPVVMLMIGAVPNALRSMILVSAACFFPSPQKPEMRRPPPRQSGNRPVVKFLAGAQITNFLKNGSVPIETIILAAFASPATVAMYRVARAVQGAPNAAMNILYQRVYPELARVRPRIERREIIRRLQRRSVAICMLTYPLSAGLALGYALLKPEVGIIELQLITAGTFLALLPAALQQGAFAILSLAGDHRSAGAAYGFSYAFLGATSLLLFLWPRMEVFMAGIIGAAFVRLWFLKLRSRRAFGSLPEPALA